MDLSEFIEKERARIVEEWEEFAGTLMPAAGSMDAPGLRDHADEILSAIVEDMRSPQSATEQAEKSKGRKRSSYLEEVGTLHAELRLSSGFKLGQMVAEYRALRASVLRLWQGNDPVGVMRFNEAVDQALTEAVESFADSTERFRDQAVGILGHDLRNPLTGILTGASLLTEQDSLDDGTVRVATRMLNSANRMSRMIDDLLDFTRTRFGKPIPVSPAPADLEPLCRQVIAELEAHRPTGELRFTAEGDLRGEWDADRIAQVLSNLVGNAIQHGSSDPIDLVARGEGDQVVVEVHSGGAAIPPEVLQTLFEPMVGQKRGREGGGGGLGLGLYIACQIVQAHGGALQARSAEERMTFTVRLPRRAPPALRD